MTDLQSDGRDLSRCIELALSDAGLDPAQIDHISGHGSSTQQNDKNETKAVKSVFGEHTRRIPVNSLNSMTGHALAAANAIEAVALCLEIQRQIIHPTINQLTPECDLDYVAQSARQSAIRAAVKLSSGFSGIHSVFVLKAA